MSERKVIYGAVMAECFHPGFGGLVADLLTDQEPRTGQVAVVVLKAEDYAALTAERDRNRELLRLENQRANDWREQARENGTHARRCREIVQEAATFPCRAPDPPCSAHSPEHWCMTCRARHALNREE